MGTNFYHEVGVCEHCGYGPEKMHIGKASMGWTFHWQGDVPGGVQDCREWFRRLARGGRIVDEYGKEHTFAEFWLLVEERREAKHHHAREYPGPTEWTDIDGCAFSSADFS